MRPRRVLIGRIVRPHGIRGELGVAVITDHKDRFANLASVWLTRGGNELGRFEIERQRPLGDGVGLKLRGIDSREAGAELRGVLLEAEALSPDSLPEDTYYTFDLIGLDVVGDEGSRIGTVSDVLSFPANDVLVVNDGQAERMIPLVGSVIEEVDLARRRITIHLLPGLLDP